MDDTDRLVQCGIVCCTERSFGDTFFSEQYRDALVKSSAACNETMAVAEGAMDKTMDGFVALSCFGSVFVGTRIFHQGIFKKCVLAGLAYFIE